MECPRPKLSVEGAQGPTGRSLFLLAGLLVLLAVKGDGRFPWPATVPEPTFQLYVLGLTLLFGLGLVLLVTGRPAGAASPPALRVAAAISGAFMLLDCGVLWLEARRYATFGYTWRLATAILICLLPASAFALLALRRRAIPPAALLAIAAIAHCALTLYACAFFPLAAARSDMLPLLVEAGHKLLSGRDPYTSYQITQGPATYLTYLPGLTLAYLPACMLKIDPRLLGLVYTLAASLVLYYRARGGAAALLSVFLINPYLIYRHDIYLAPFWLLLAVAWAALARPRPATLAANCGALVLTSQLLVLPALALTIFGFKRFGPEAMLRRLVPAVLASAAVLGLFLLPDRASFMRGTIGRWQGALNVESLGLSYWLLFFLSAAAIHILQAVVLIAILLLAMRTWIRSDRPASTFAVSALALFAFAALNTVIWTYFYLAVLFLAVLSQLDSEPDRRCGLLPSLTR